MNTNTLKPVVQYLLPVAVVGVGALAYLHVQTPFSLQALIAPCTEPITYAITTYDERFDISRADFEAAVAEAASVWNLEAGKILIEKREDGEVAVGLQYDERQFATEVGEVIEREQETYQRLKAEVDSLKERYNTLAEAYERDAAAFERRADRYQEEVVKWNAQGGAPPNEYAALEREQQALNREEARLNRVVADVNELADSIQESVNRLNTLAARTNAKVDVYNEAVGHDFDQGNYIEDENGKRITIYEFSNRKELVRVLAHEFGHALGLEHTDDPDSLMYSYNIATGLTLTDADTAELARVCRF